MHRSTNVKVMVWGGIIVASLVLGLMMDIEPTYKYVFVGATILIGLGIMVAFREK